MTTTQEQLWMKRALQLALKGRGAVSPNPRVGAVIIDRGGNIAGEGWHHRCGEAHAEIEALQNCTGCDISGGALIVTLEPCCHQGKTPPCTEAIIKSGLKRIVAAVLDPNSKVNGRGIRALRKAGLDVKVGVLGEEARWSNRGYFSYRQRGRAWCAVKVAVSLDGKMANPEGRSKWITGEPARRLAHRLRADYDAILVGSHTLRQDDPELTVRLARGPNPVRLILSPHYGLPAAGKIAKTLRGNRTILLTGEQMFPPGTELDDLEVLKLPLNKTGMLDPQAILRELPQYGILSALIEGGAGVLSSFMQAGVVDEIFIGLAPTVIGQGLSPFAYFQPISWEGRPRYKLHRVQRLSEDIILSYRREGNPFSPD